MLSVRPMHGELSLEQRADLHAPQEDHRVEVRAGGAWRGGLVALLDVQPVREPLSPGGCHHGRHTRRQEYHARRACPGRSPRALKSAVASLKSAGNPWGGHQGGEGRLGAGPRHAAPGRGDGEGLFLLLRALPSIRRWGTWPDPRQDTEARPGARFAHARQRKRAAAARAFERRATTSVFEQPRPEQHRCIPRIGGEAR